MGFFSTLLRRPSNVETAFTETHQHSVAASTRAAQLAAATAPLPPNAVRKQIVHRILKETLRSNGVPPTWVAADVLVAKSRNREPGLHVRFVIRHWDVRLVQHSLDLQDNFNDRLLALEPAAVDWLMGYSWQYNVQGARQGKGLPHPASWTAMQTPRMSAGSGAVAESDSEVAADLAALMAIRVEDASPKST